MKRKQYFAKQEGRKGFAWFEIDHCDKCDAEIEGPNTVTVLEPRAKLERQGMIYRDSMPEPACYDGDTDTLTCGSCAD